MKRVAPALGFLFLLGLLLLSTQVRSPYLSSFRPFVTPMFVLVGIALAFASVRRFSGLSKRLVLASTSLIVLIPVGLELRYASQKSRVLEGGQLVNAVARHVIVGYRDVESLETLLDKVEIGGIFVTARNVQGRTVEEVAIELGRLRSIAASRGFALWVTADQEGGVVTRLSPPLPPLAPLSSVATSAGQLKDGWEAAVQAYADTTAQGLIALGVDVNFAPVVDLRDPTVDPTIDLHSRIADRAISSEPEVIARVSRTYSRQLQQHGILPVAKHFPGLGRVNADTHHVTGHLASKARELQTQEWLPFQTLAQAPPMGVMVGHVVVDALEPRNVASASEVLVGEVLRGSLHHRGLIFTDDMCMSPVYYGPGGMVGHAQRSLLAGVDYLLVTFDPSLVYPLLADLAQQLPDPALTQALRASDERIVAARNALRSPKTQSVE